MLGHLQTLIFIGFLNGFGIQLPKHQCELQEVLDPHIVIVKQIPGAYVRAHLIEVSKAGVMTYQTGQFGGAEDYEEYRFEPHVENRKQIKQLKQKEVENIREIIEGLQGQYVLDSSFVLDSWKFSVYIDGKRVAQIYESNLKNYPIYYTTLIEVFMDLPKKNL